MNPQASETATAGTPDGRSSAAERPEVAAPKRRSLRRRVADWLTATAVIAVATLAAHLPESLLWWLTDRAGSIAYRVSGSRRTRARRNLRRVVEWMAANDVGPESYRKAATDSRALEAIVRSAFRNHARYYGELARTPRCNARWVEERLVIEDRDRVEAELAQRRALILVGMHFGAIELPGFVAAQRLGEVVAPMEFIDNERLQRYISRTRASVGLRHVTLEEAGHELLAALRRNEPVGLIADRDLTGGGIEVELFGGRTKIPAGPVLLVAQTGAPMYVSGVRRTSPGHYLGNLRTVPLPGGASRRERSRAMAQEEAHLFERAIADAPEQWMAVFHPIWPDLEDAAERETVGAA
jgi:KDO2-lipid IV(A) lauroyltransferase